MFLVNNELIIKGTITEFDDYFIVNNGCNHTVPKRDGVEVINIEYNFDSNKEYQFINGQVIELKQNVEPTEKERIEMLEQTMLELMMKESGLNA